MRRLRIGVIYGGRSSEHAVSLASAAAIFANLDRERYEPVPIRIAQDGRWTLAEHPPTLESAAETTELARVERGRAGRSAREVHLTRTERRPDPGRTPKLRVVMDPVTLP